MGYNLNTEAYQFFIQIEVGLREFLINIIRQQGVSEWVNTFLGQIQRDTLNDVIRRLNESNKQDKIPQIEDQYLFKINRALKNLEASFQTSKLFHPFYYLNWNDLENLMRMKANSTLIDQSIGKQNRKVLADTLCLLSHLRNDVAHSRFISENDLIIISTSFNQISALIPDFKLFCQAQTKEDKLDLLLQKLKDTISLIESKTILESETISEIILFLKVCQNSFWLNSIGRQILALINDLHKMMEEYYKFRKSPGGLLQIQKLKEKNSILIINLKNSLSDGKI